MGQYYKCVMGDKNNNVVKYEMSIRNDKAEKGYDFCGMKLMEHSYVNCSIMKFIASKIYNNPMYLAWVGDYAEQDDLMYNYSSNNVDLKVDKAWTEYGDDGKELPSEYGNDLLMEYVNEDVFRNVAYFVNHDKKEYIDVKKYLDASENVTDYIVSPISLMTVIGNGRGGGDYHSEFSREYVGAWKWCLVELTDTVADDYTEITPLFYEDY